MNGTPASRQLSADDARASLWCTRCFADHHGNGYVVEKVEIDSMLDRFTPVAKAEVRTRRIVSVGKAANPKHSYCLDCVEKRQHELQVKDRKSALRAKVKRTKSNQHNDDCTVVAVSVATGLHYDQVMKRAMANHGYKPGRGRGIANISWRELLIWAADKRGYDVETLVDPTDTSVYDRGSRGLTASRLAEAYSAKGERLAVSAAKGMKGHAMPITNGKVHNTSTYDGWDRAKVIGAWRLIKR